MVTWNKGDEPRRPNTPPATEENSESRLGYLAGDADGQAGPPLKTEGSLSTDRKSSPPQRGQASHRFGRGSVESVDSSTKPHSRHSLYAITGGHP